MFVPGLIQGRWLDTEDLEALRGLIAEHPHWSRRQRSIALCEVLDWRTARGQLKDMSARLLLNKLAEGGFMELPPRQRGGGRRVLRALWEPELFTLSAGGGDLIRVRADWQRKYHTAPCLAETFVFVERERFGGVCYRAANWLRVGQTCGRSRHDRDHTLRVPIKDIYRYPLCSDFKERLCA